MVNKLKALDIIALVLVIIGGLNWGSYAFNPPSQGLVEILIGSWSSLLAQVVYLLVAISAIYLAIVMRKLGRK